MSMSQHLMKKKNGRNTRPDRQTDYNMIDWINKHHFDYRGLIPMGLALEAPEGIYKID